jgi:N-acetylglucosaminyl-diphospho-decaprenol L-rhamnosyltransferase
VRLSYVIITRNRRESLLKTLAKLERNTLLPRHSWEAIVVDNCSDDGTPAAVHRAFRDTRIVRLDENEGMPARNHGFAVAKGKYVAIIDDDSYPIGRAIPLSIAHLDRNDQTAAVVARVRLPDGSSEGPALPCILLGGASVIRKSVLDQVGGFSPEFFRQAEEYDLSFRILAAGYRIERFEDVEFFHEKVPGGRSNALTHRMDLRNNLILVERFLPRELRREYRRDWIRRYSAFALHDGHRDAATQALSEARVWARREHAVGRRTLTPTAIETIMNCRGQADLVRTWSQQHRVRRVAIADFGKNLFTTCRASREANLEIVALVDSRPAFRDGRYRAVPIVEPVELDGLGVDGVIVANINPAQIDSVEANVRESFAGPVLRLWEPRFLKPRKAFVSEDVRAA